MNKIPFYFYIDISIVDLTNPEKASLLKSFKEWMCELDRHSYIGAYNSSKYDGAARQFLGITNAVNSSLGARYSSSEVDFTEFGATKVTLEYWDKKIKNKKYTAIANATDHWGDPIEGRGVRECIKVVSLKRNEICMAPSRSREITTELKRMGLDTKKFQGPYILEKRWVNSFQNGYFLCCETTVEVNGYYYPKHYVDSVLLRNGDILKCPVSGNFSTRDKGVQAGVIDERGNVVEMPTYYRTPIKSNRHGKFFTTEDAARNAGYVLCPATHDWVLPGEEKEVPNAGYHKLERVPMCDISASEFTIGFEIEKEDKKAKEDIGYKKLYDRTKWCKERDGSLNEASGYELVSPVYDLFSSKLDKDVRGDKDLIQLIDGKYSKNCGGHINIGSKVYSPIQLLYGIQGFLPLLYSIWSVRVDNSYSRAYKIHEYSGGKNAIKIKPNVIEIRIATAVKSVKNMLWRRDLVRIMMKNINKSEQEVLRMMLNPRSILHKHLRKVYNSQRFMEKCNDFVKYAETFSNIKLDEPNWDALDAAKAERVTTVEED